MQDCRARREKESMKGCPSCRDLDGRCAEAGPTGEMRAESQYFTSDGIFETYRCRACGSQWQRFVAAEEPGARSGPWKNLARPAGGDS
jgi:hypothetical protein